MSKLAFPKGDVAGDGGSDQSVAFDVTEDGVDAIAESEHVVSLRRTDKPEWTPVLIHLRDPAWNPELPGLQKIGRMGSVLAARVTREALDAVAADHAVISVEASRQGGVECAQSLPFVHADVVHAPPLSETGAGVIVAMIDDVDVLHEAFQVAGKTRFLFVWDQRDVTGPVPAIVDPVRFGEFGIGTLHTTADIDAYLAAASAGKRLGRDRKGHGTHVLSIAAGTPLPAVGFPGGVAPDADLVVVIPKMDAAPGDAGSLGYSATHVSALGFIKAVAGKEEKAVVVNVSLGQNAGAHDGASALEIAFDEFSGGGREAGLAIVKSAGNEWGLCGHAEVVAFEGGVVPLSWTTTTDLRASDNLEFWFDAADDLQFTLKAPGGLAASVDLQSTFQRVTDKVLVIELSLVRFHVDNGDSRLTIAVRSALGGFIDTAGEWSLDVLGRSIRAEGVIHGWVERDSSRAVSFKSGDTDACTVTIPGTARTVIAVGACGSAEPLGLHERSSHGPTRDNRRKPEVVAPGMGITAAQAGTANGLIAKSGTSMAAPHVTGAVALLMGHRLRSGLEQINAAQARAALVRSAARFSGRWQSGFGYGRLDVAALLETFA